ncbi:MAG: hypothetical protein M0Q42_06555 [Xanthomonadales bacterium]|nr:hypothetical protein [Xanthomonadales bacterium]
MAASILKPMPAELWNTGPMAWLLAAALVLALFALAALAGLVTALRRRRPLRILSRLTAFLVLALLALAASLLAVSLHGYDRLTDEVPVATIGFTQTGVQAFSAELALADGRHLVLPVLGDEWQLDARVLKWAPWAVLAGLDPLYQLDRFSGRWRDIDNELGAPRSVHDLTGGRALDLWRLAWRHPHWLPFVDTDYGSSAYLPMRDGARFQVSLSPLGGLVARAVVPATAAPGD